MSNHIVASILRGWWKKNWYEKSNNIKQKPPYLKYERLGRSESWGLS